MSGETVIQEVKKRGTLLATGGNHSEDAFDKATASSRVGAITKLAPDDPLPQGAFNGIICRFDVVMARKGPQHVEMLEQATAEAGCFGVCDLCAAFQPSANILLVLGHLSAKGLAGECPITHSSIALEQLLTIQHQHRAHPGRSRLTQLESFKMTQQVCPTSLMTFATQKIVGGEAVRAGNTP